MGHRTSISWCHDTFNPWWGCVEVSPACDNCYARDLSKRYGHDVWGKAPRRFFGDKHWDEPLKWNRAAAEAGERRRVFCASMADVFEKHAELDAWRWRLWRLIESTPHLDWLLLTKRTHLIRRYYPAGWLGSPPHNVWLGTTVESQRYADERIVHLLSVPAVVHFLSCEPLLGPVDLGGIRFTAHEEDSRRIRREDGRRVEWQLDVTTGRYAARPGGLGWRPWSKAEDPALRALQKLSWVIAGGESGSKSRVVHPKLYRSLRDQCVATGVPFHFKQWGEFVDPMQLQDTAVMGGKRASRIVCAEGDVMALKDSAACTAHDERGHDNCQPAPLVRLGKKISGRELDGRTWDELPAPRAA